MHTKYVNPHSEPVRFGVIGGSGVYKLDCLHDPIYYEVDTPFGKPSGPICVARVEGVLTAFLPRHGTHHSLNPSEVNYRANICAMKIMGVAYLLAINAVGSLDANYRPGDLAIVSQLIDKTVKRENTFFGGGVVAHVDFAHPTSQQMSSIAFTAMQACFPEVPAGTAGWKIHPTGTLCVMEGPQFSTKAESLLNKQLGGHMIGMTSCPEAKLAREAEMAYMIVAMVTDMDAWSDEPHVDVLAVMKAMAANSAKAQKYPAAILTALQEHVKEDPAHSALQYTIMTKPEAMSVELKEQLAPLVAAKYPQYKP